LLTGIFIAQYFLASDALTAVTTELNQWGIIITAGTLLFGNVAIIVIKGRELTKKQPRKALFDTAVFLGVAALFVILGLVDPKSTKGAIFLAIYTPTMSMMSQTLWTNAHLYYDWSIIQRLVRVRTLEVAVLAFTTLLVAFYNTPFIKYLYPPFGPIGEWITVKANGAVQSATAICLGIASIVIVVRALAGREPGLIEMEMA
jgi:hypothetical protein